MRGIIPKKGGVYNLILIPSSSKRLTAKRERNFSIEVQIRLQSLNLGTISSSIHRYQRGCSGLGERREEQRGREGTSFFQEKSKGGLACVFQAQYYMFYLKGKHRLS